MNDYPVSLKSIDWSKCDGCELPLALMGVWSALERLVSGNFSYNLFSSDGRAGRTATFESQHVVQ